MIRTKKPPKRVLCRFGGVSRKVGLGERFEVDVLGVRSVVEVAEIKASTYTSEELPVTSHVWYPVLRYVGTSERPS